MGLDGVEGRTATGTSRLHEGEVMILEEYNFKREVLDDPGPVLVDFWAEWCGPCRAMNPVLHELAADYKICKVNIDTNEPLARKFQVSAVPTLLIFQRGQVVRRHEGVTPAHALRAELSAFSGRK